MIRTFFAAAALCAALALPALAADPVAEPAGRQLLGFGHFLDNDLLGDGKDRWRTGSYQVSIVTGPEWNGQLPGFGAILEYRIRGEVLAPANLRDPAADDRRYAAVLSFGLHSHFALAGAEATAGIDLVAMGPDTGVARFQKRLHDLADAAPVDAADTQFGNRIMPTLSFELGRAFGAGSARLRPFVEGRAGDETLLRAGADLEFGRLERGALWVRDLGTGQRYVSVSGQSQSGASFVLGADAAWVADSAYLPSDEAAEMSRERFRVRAGVNVRGGGFGLFYGLTWLSEEFRDQPEGQVVGSIRLRMSF